ncbi:hypothetical protein BDN72DRAFT_831264 [Pluteus cervinus]|uniref:Uncharacterized protein n=1 Tax=Pluteus cervinus TaxID=181527 RepID=A0ACD3BDV4_9AGAR|nr:hypothetical protein BDN72DRAFT_831264 [Pluteus cervinus]
MLTSPLVLRCSARPPTMPWLGIGWQIHGISCRSPSYHALGQSPSKASLLFVRPRFALYIDRLSCPCSAKIRYFRFAVPLVIKKSWRFYNSEADALRFLHEAERLYSLNPSSHRLIL